MVDADGDRIPLRGPVTAGAAAASTQQHEGTLEKFLEKSN